MSLNYIKFYKPANVVAGFESHSRRSTSVVIQKKKIFVLELDQFVRIISRNMTNIVKFI
jgi:hypothetical protein